MVIVIICDVSERHIIQDIKNNIKKKTMPNIAKECRLHAKKAGLLLNWCAAVEIKKSFWVFRAAYSIMESIKGSWKTRVYSRIFIDNIGNQGFIPEIIYYKRKHRKPTLIGHFLEL